MLTRANKLDSRSPTYRNGRAGQGGRRNARGRRQAQLRGQACAGSAGRRAREAQNRESGKTDRQFGGSDSESVSGEGYDEATATKHEFAQEHEPPISVPKLREPTNTKESNFSGGRRIPRLREAILSQAST